MVSCQRFKCWWLFARFRACAFVRNAVVGFYCVQLKFKMRRIQEAKSKCQRQMSRKLSRFSKLLKLRSNGNFCSKLKYSNSRNSFEFYNATLKLCQTWAFSQPFFLTLYYIKQIDNLTHFQSKFRHNVRILTVSEWQEFCVIWIIPFHSIC